MLWFVGCIAALAVGVFNIILTKKRRVVDGEVVEVNASDKSVCVLYRPSDSAPPCEAWFKITDGNIPTAGQRVLVSLVKQGGTEPVPKIMRYNTMHKNRTMAGAEKAAFVIATVCLVMGIVSLF